MNDNIIDWLNSNKSILVFGAHLIAMEVTSCLESAPFDCKVQAFVVSDKKDNPDIFCGRKVMNLDEAGAVFSDDMPMVIATSGKYLDSILENIRNKGFKNVVELTFESDSWSVVQGLYASCYCRKKNIPYHTFHGVSSEIEERPSSTAIYSVHSIYDKPLKENKVYPIEIPIQVGAALTDQKVCDVTDNRGENISRKNKQYCELTGLYWIWKNDTSLVKGLCHYRRHFNISQSDLDRLYGSDIDVIVTDPILNFPDVKTVYAHDHNENDWKVLKDAVAELFPEYLDSFEQMENGRFYFAYNMFIARGSVFSDYCSFLFPVLSYCESHCGKHDNEYQSRYIGFLAERMLIVYLMGHKEDLNVQVISKHFAK